MPLEIAPLALGLVVNLIADAVGGVVKVSALPYFTKRRMIRRVEDATAEVIEPLLPFLANEGLSEAKQKLLIQAIIDELRPVANDPVSLLNGSLDGQKIFDQVYASRPLPQVILDEGMKDVYALIFPRIATLLCKLPLAVKEWESEAWAENFRRFDDIANQLRALFGRVDELASAPSREGDETLSLVRRTSAQTIGLELDLTGLRSDRPLAGRFDDFFVHPELSTEEKKKGPEKRDIGSEEEAFAHFIAPGRRAIIVGAPGAGKSTWTKWLQRKALTTAWQGLAVRMELRRLKVSSLPSVYGLVRSSISHHLSDELPNERITRWLRGKLILFILDGFDEIRPSDRDAVIKWMMGLRDVVRNCPLIVTSRPLTTGHLAGLEQQWQTWTVAPFNEQRIVEYIGRWYQYTPLLVGDEVGVDAAGLARAWRLDPTIGPLTGNPLLLSTLLMVHHIDGSLPAGRSELYRRYVDGMLGIWDDRRHVAATSVQLTLDEKRKIIRGFALHLFDEEQEQLDEGDAIAWLAGFLTRLKLELDAETVLSALRERSGLIVGPGVYGFAHKSIAEFFVADAIVQGDQRDRGGGRIDRFMLFEHRANDRWNTVTFLWSGLAPVADVMAFVVELLDGGDVSLAAGVLLDQYQRLAHEERRALLIRLLRVLSDLRRGNPLTVGLTQFIVSHPKGLDVNLPLPTFHVRGLLPFASFHSLLFRALGDQTLVWSDRSGLARPLRDLFWMWAARGYRERDVWRECLGTEMPAQGDERWWHFWAAENVFLIAMKNSPDKLYSVIEDYRKAAPERAGLILIALLSAALFTYHHYRDHQLRRGLWKDCVKCLLAVLPRLEEGAVDQDWLGLSRDWVVGYGDSGESTGDLLNMFGKAVREVAEGESALAASSARAFELLSKLETRREMFEG